MAGAYLGLKEYDKALDWVEKAVKERGFAKLDTLQGEKFAPVREIPRFKALLADVERSLGIGQAGQGILRGVNLSGDTLTKAIVDLL